jgi:hypothetical protein
MIVITRNVLIGLQEEELATMIVMLQTYALKVNPKTITMIDLATT